jgi:methylenetetrahydrofolate reductase (NADPH)
VRIATLYGADHPAFSFEFFPPKSADAADALLKTVEELRDVHRPDWVSVTYGAGGSTRGITVDLVSRIQSELSLPAMAHLTCVGHTAEELRGVVDQLIEKGVHNVLALRGDPPKGETKFERREGGFGFASELVTFLRETYGADQLGIGGACYPEAHPESKDMDADLRWTKHKVDQGLGFLITQLFFDDAQYLSYVTRARAAGIDVPIVPGIMPITNVKQIERFTKMCGASIPKDLHARLTRYADDPASVMAIGIEHAIRQCRGLLEAGAPGLHFYTLNKSHATRSILAAI